MAFEIAKVFVSPNVTEGVTYSNHELDRGHTRVLSNRVSRPFIQLSLRTRGSSGLQSRVISPLMVPIGTHKNLITYKP
jgi:hypothetical protein